MAGFAIFETANLRAKFKIPGCLVGYRKAIVSIKQENLLVEYSTDDTNVSVDEDQDIVYIFLDQDDTSKFKKGCAQLQINVYYYDKERHASGKATLQIRDNLHKEVMV